MAATFLYLRHTLDVEPPSVPPPKSSCSKAPGVFSSNCRKPASSPVLYFHRASPRDSSPVITPFVCVQTYWTRNFAALFLKTVPCLLESKLKRGREIFLLAQEQSVRLAFALKSVLSNFKLQGLPE